MTGKLSLLRIEIDGHYHGSPDVPRPWVAEITGTCPEYGLARSFLKPMNDWASASVACSGNVYGRVAQFALRNGRVYEVFRLKGKPSKRHPVREFIRVENGKRTVIDPESALAAVDGVTSAAVIEIDQDERSSDSWVSEVTGLGTPRRLGFVVVNFRRKYRCRDGLYEVSRSGERRFVLIRDLNISHISEREALELLLCR